MLQYGKRNFIFLIKVPLFIKLYIYIYSQKLEVYLDFAYNNYIIQNVTTSYLKLHNFFR